MSDVDLFYAPSPQKIKTVVIVEHNGMAVTYSDLISAVTAVYGLNSIEKEWLQKTLAGAKRQ